MVDHLTKAREAAIKQRELRISQGLAANKTPMEKVADNPTSLRICVNAKCYDCNGRENYVNRTRYCQIFDCPLWTVRPYSKGITQEQCLEYEEWGADINEDDSSEEELEDLSTIA